MAHEHEGVTDDDAFVPESPWSRPPPLRSRSETDAEPTVVPDVVPTAVPDVVPHAFDAYGEVHEFDEFDSGESGHAIGAHSYPDSLDAPEPAPEPVDPGSAPSDSPDDDPWPPGFLRGESWPDASLRGDWPPPQPSRHPGPGRSPERSAGPQFRRTADEFSTRRAVRPREWAATSGVRAAARRGSFGLVRLRPGRQERERRACLTAVRRAFGGLRQVTVVNPKGGAGKTVATLMIGAAFGQARGGFVLAWDNNETQGTLGMRAQPVVRPRTVRDLLRDLDRFCDGGGRVGELAAYVRAQDEVMFDVLASDESATAGEMLTARAFRQIREVVGQFYKVILVDTGNNVRAENWQAALDATDQLVITMSARNDSAETAARLLDHLDQTGRHEQVRRAVTVVTMPPHRKDVNPRPVEQHFGARCRTVLRVPYDKHLDAGAPVRYSAISPDSRRAWLRVAAAVAEGL